MLIIWKQLYFLEDMVQKRLGKTRKQEPSIFVHVHGKGECNQIKWTGLREKLMEILIVS